MSFDRMGLAPHARGVTLLELLVTLAIVGSVMVLSVPLVTGGTDTARLRSAARELSTVLRHARAQAIARQQETRVRFDLDRRLYTASGTGRFHPLDEALDIRLLSADFRGLDRRVGELRFWPDGSASGGEVLLAGGGRAYAVSVQWLTGRVSIRERHGADE